MVVEILAERNSKIFILDLGGCSLVAEWMAEADPQQQAYLGCLSLTHVPDEENLGQLIEKTNFTFDCPYILVIGPINNQEDVAKREIRLLKSNQQITQTFNAVSNPAIVTQRSVKQALNFLRISIQEGRI